MIKEHYAWVRRPRQAVGQFKRPQKQSSSIFKFGIGSTLKYWKTDDGTQVMAWDTKSQRLFIAAARSISSSCCCKTNLIKPIIEDQLNRWTFPQTGYLKLNIDGTWRGTSSAGGEGVIRKDDGSWFVGFFASFKAKNPLTAELKALLIGLKISQSYNINMLQVETDAKIIVELLEEDSDCQHHESIALINEIAGMLATSSWAVSIGHIRREANTVAHALANISYGMEENYKVFTDVPLSVRHAFRKDLGQAAGPAIPSTS